MDLADIMEFSVTAAQVGHREMVVHMEEEAPLEAVGWLWDDGSLTRFVNQARSSERFAVGSTQMADALAAVDPDHKSLIGLYHSHPNGNRLPSAYDEEQMRLQFASGIPIPWLIITPDHALSVWWWGETDELVGMEIHRSLAPIL